MMKLTTKILCASLALYVNTSNAANFLVHEYGHYISEPFVCFGVRSLHDVKLLQNTDEKTSYLLKCGDSIMVNGSPINPCIYIHSSEVDNDNHTLEFDNEAKECYYVIPRIIANAPLDEINNKCRGVFLSRYNRYGVEIIHIKKAAIISQNKTSHTIHFIDDLYFYKKNGEQLTHVEYMKIKSIKIEINQNKSWYQYVKNYIYRHNPWLFSTSY